MDLNAVYSGKKVFLTGHTGFKGTWLLTWLHSLGAVVKGYSLAPLNSFDLYHSIDGDVLCDSILADILDREKVKEEILNFEPDFVFHLAAQPLVRLSYDIPVDTFAINAIGSANVLDALRFFSKPCVAVMITTDKVYHNKELNYHYREDDRLGGYDPYSASKACAELVIDSYRNSYFNPDKYQKHKKSISVGRAGNVIGGGDWASDRIIPDIIKALSNDTEVQIRNPSSVRPWQHVMEPLFGYLTLAAHQAEDPVKFADQFNFGPHKEDNFTVLQLVEKAIEIWGSGTYHTPEITGQPHEAGLLQLDITKANSVLNWQPKFESAVAIEKTISWYKNCLENEDSAKKLVLNDIKAYSSI